MDNINGTFICAIIVISCGTYYPYKIISSENHTIITQIDKIRFIGPFLILIGTIGFLLCFWNFIFDAKRSPLPADTQNYLIEKGLYQYVRNPMYISWFLIVIGEILLFRSLDLIFYLLAWVVFFHPVQGPVEVVSWIFPKRPMPRTRCGRACGAQSLGLHRNHEQPNLSIASVFVSNPNR